jgi:hypothetical protein
MDEQKFTPGPWKTKGPSPGLLRSSDDGGDYAVMDEEGFILAEAFRLVGLGNERPAAANADLIAAAPALYAALEAAIDLETELVQRNHGPAAQPSLPWLAQAAAALSKARAES